MDENDLNSLPVSLALLSSCNCNDIPVCKDHRICNVDLAMTEWL